jgi:hypothetical protein
VTGVATGICTKIVSAETSDYGDEFIVDDDLGLSPFGSYLNV